MIFLAEGQATHCFVAVPVQHTEVNLPVMERPKRVPLDLACRVMIKEQQTADGQVLGTMLACTMAKGVCFNLSAS